jgi:hypothetical protein
MEVLALTEVLVLMQVLPVRASPVAREFADWQAVEARGLAQRLWHRRDFSRAVTERRDFSQAVTESLVVHRLCGCAADARRGRASLVRRIAHEHPVRAPVHLCGSGPLRRPAAGWAAAAASRAEARNGSSALVVLAVHRHADSARGDNCAGRREAALAWAQHRDSNGPSRADDLPIHVPNALPNAAGNAGPSSKSTGVVADNKAAVRAR